MRKTYVFGAIISGFLFIALISPALSRTATYTTLPANPPQDTLQGQGWRFTVLFPVHNKSTIEKLIQCESRGVNIARPDSNGLDSWGILQFNGTSTWNEMERRFSFYGNPLAPADAIHMADMMIDAGFLARWSCARILGLIPHPSTGFSP